MALENTRAFALDAVCLRQKCDSDSDLGYDLMKRFSSIVVKRFLAAQMQLIDVFGTSDDERQAGSLYSDNT